MHKKFSLVFVIVLLITTLVVAPSFAKAGKGNVKGQVISIDVQSRSISILTNQGATLNVIVPAEFDFSSVQVGDTLLVKGVYTSDASITADWVKVVGKGQGKSSSNDNDENEAEGSKQNSAYCAAGKQQKPHPLATKIAERYGVSEGWVMEYFCQGYGMGAIMLALQTAEINAGDPAVLLADRASGKGWGQIWKELGLIGNEKQGNSPPGLLKKNNKNPKSVP